LNILNQLRYLPRRKRNNKGVICSFLTASPPGCQKTTKVTSKKIEERLAFILSYLKLNPIQEAQADLFTEREIPRPQDEEVQKEK
jgi:hypothetical protein